MEVNDPLNDNDIELQQPRNTASTSETTSNQSNTSANRVDQHNSTKIAVINDTGQSINQYLNTSYRVPFREGGSAKKVARAISFILILNSLISCTNHQKPLMLPTLAHDSMLNYPRSIEESLYLDIRTHLYHNSMRSKV